MMTPEPDGGFYKDADAESFISKFGYADKHDKPDRLNFGGRHVVGQRCPPTGLTMQLLGFNAATGAGCSGRWEKLGAEDILVRHGGPNPGHCACIRAGYRMIMFHKFDHAGGHVAC